MSMLSELSMRLEKDCLYQISMLLYFLIVSVFFCGLHVDCKVATA